MEGMTWYFDDVAWCGFIYSHNCFMLFYYVLLSFISFLARE